MKITIIQWTSWALGMIMAFWSTGTLFHFTSPYVEGVFQYSAAGTYAIVFVLGTFYFALLIAEILVGLFGDES